MIMTRARMRAVQSMSYKFDFSFLAERWPDFVAGAWLTIQLTVVSIALGLAVGTVCALLRVYGNRWVRAPVGFYVELIRNTPLLVQIFIVYFGLSSLGLKLSAEVSAVIALVVNMGAYTTEIMRAGIQSIQRTQLEAADCLGLTRLQTIVHVVLLPAMERVYPALSSQFVLLMLASSITSQISAEELDRHRQPRAVRHLPELRGLHHRGRRLSRPVGALPLRLLADRAGAVRAQAQAGHSAVIQLNANHFIYLLQAAQWTLLLSLIAFVGGSMRRPGAGAAARVEDRRAACPRQRLHPAHPGHAAAHHPVPVVFRAGHHGLQAGADRGRRPRRSRSMPAAFLGEIWRGCIEAVPRTQWEASDCLGLNRFQQYAYVILPQAVQLAIPPTVGFMVQIVKNTSLASVIGFVELARAGQIVNNSTFEPFTIFTVVAAIYFAMCYPLSLAARALERKAHAGR